MKMIKINTRDFGELEVGEDKIFEFPVGLFAFEEARHFALISPLGEGVYPMWLQCTDALKPCFIVFDPSLIDLSYSVALTEDEKKILKVSDGNEIKTLAIAKVPSDYRETTVNMKSPIVINAENKTAMQVILPYDYQFRLPLYKNETEGTVDACCNA